MAAGVSRVAACTDTRRRVRQAKGGRRRQIEGRSGRKRRRLRCPPLPTALDKHLVASSGRTKKIHVQLVAHGRRPKPDREEGVIVVPRPSQVLAVRADCRGIRSVTREAKRANPVVHDGPRRTGKQPSVGNSGEGDPRRRVSVRGA